MDIGSVIRDIRKKKKITQTQLAKLSQITQTYLSQIENNQKEPTIPTLKAIPIVFLFPSRFSYFYLSKTRIFQKKTGSL
ncbi:helix-turn-helix domain-containing protein [Rikenella microfusus]|uniref:helix-turn-helix domain-containing protein n=1 Tax=Rikenella microfusus TaxID=28139 RepID=UPI0009FF18A5